jgi:acyl dehydratase
MAFAQQFDPPPFHLGEPIAGGIVGRRGEIEWPRPTRPGDVLYVESESVSIEASKAHPDRGRVMVRSETRNQGEEIVQVATMTLVVPRRGR